MLESSTELESSAEATAQPAPVVPTAGAMLREARERAGLTREMVAGQLNLLTSHVAALEDDDYSRFPGETFVRGHLRSYARLLNICAEELLCAYGGTPVDTCRAAPAPATLQWRPVSLEQRTSHWRRYSGLAATLLVLAGMWAWHQRHDAGHRLSLTAEGGAGAQEFAGGIDSALASGSDNALLDSVQLLPNTPSADDQAKASAAGEQGAAAGAEEVDKLSLRFSADCWIEIKDRDNKLIVATLKHADEKLQIEGHGPFKVLLGYAPGVSMAYNGTPVKVDVSEGTRSTRMIVGSS